jgi:dienelactone hydrolase
MPNQKGKVERHPLRLHVGDAVVPAILLLPPGIEHQVPAALLLHGYSSRKERMADTIGRALAVRGVASLAIDLPLHGERDAPLQRQSLLNPMALVRHWRLALAECAEALDCLAKHERYDASRLAIVGYSVGAYVGVATAARDKRVRAVVLAAAGDLPLGTPFERLVRTVAESSATIKRPSTAHDARAIRSDGAPGRCRPPLRRRRRAKGDAVVEHGPHPTGRGDRGRGGVARDSAAFADERARGRGVA